MTAEYEAWVAACQVVEAHEALCPRCREYRWCAEGARLNEAEFSARSDVLETIAY